MSAIAGVWGVDYAPLDDTALLARIRGGDPEAYAELWRRHLPAAYQTAHRYRGRTSADDIVAEASLRVYHLLRAGQGPTTNFGAYFRQAVKTAAVDAARTELRVVPSEPEVLEAASGTVSAHDVEGRVNKELACAAFRRLSERDQQVLLHTTVEGSPPAVAAPALGMTPNGVSVAASRAREMLRARYLDAHADRGVARARDEECRWVLSRMGRYVRGKLPVRQRLKVQQHLAGCRHAQVLMLEMTEANQRLSALVVPLVVVAASSAGLAWTTAGSVLGALTAAEGASLGGGGAFGSAGAPEAFGHAVSGSAGATSSGASALVSGGAASAGGVGAAAGTLSGGAAGAISGASGAAAAVGGTAGALGGAAGGVAGGAGALAGGAGAVGGTAGVVSAAVGPGAAAGIAAKVAALATVGTLATPFVAGVPVSVPVVAGRGPAVVAQAPASPQAGAGTSSDGSGSAKPASDAPASGADTTVVPGSVPVGTQSQGKAGTDQAPADAAQSASGSAAAGGMALNPAGGVGGAQSPAGTAQGAAGSAAQGSAGGSSSKGSAGGSGAQSSSGGTGAGGSAPAAAQPAAPAKQKATADQPKAAATPSPVASPAAVPSPAGAGASSSSASSTPSASGTPQDKPAASTGTAATDSKPTGGRPSGDANAGSGYRLRAQKACPSGWRLIVLGKTDSKTQTFLVCRPVSAASR